MGFLAGYSTLRMVLYVCISNCDVRMHEYWQNKLSEALRSCVVNVTIYVAKVCFGTLNLDGYSYSH